MLRLFLPLEEYVVPTVLTVGALLLGRVLTFSLKFVCLHFVVLFLFCAKREISAKTKSSRSYVINPIQYLDNDDVTTNVTMMS
jgi:hypothetical protein